MEKAKGDEIDLGLALGTTSQCMDTCSNMGAGANANSRSIIDVNTRTFVRPRPLTELVWSAQNGLSIKCAVGSNLYHTDENVGEVAHFIDTENCNKGKEKAYIGTREGPQNRRTADLLPLLANESENIRDGNDRFGLDIGLPLKTQEITQIASQERPPPDIPKDEIEETAENDVNDANLENLETNQREDREEYCEDDSHESRESCNSANLMSNGNKRWRLDQKLIIGSKRIKNQSQECSIPAPGIKPDSSFMNWISNMVKGVKPYREEAHNPTNDDQKISVCDKTLNFVSKRLGFQTVFQSLYSQDAKQLETGTRVENRKPVGDSKELILLDEPVSDRCPDDNFNQNAFDNLWITRLSPKTPSAIFTSDNNSDFKSFVAKDSSTDDASASVDLKQSEFDILKNTRSMINENANVFFKKEESNLYGIPKQIASSSEKNKLSNEEKILGIPKEMFNTIRRLRLSRTDILKWMNSRLPIAKLDGYFLRLRLTKWEDGVAGSGYYVACITDENPSKGSKKPISVNIGGVECLVESRYISNCDFLEDELKVWWRTTLTSGRAPMEKELTSKLEEREMLGF